jgi:1-deoxy-D-xylulose-5-phosphate reductoisomerase
MQQLVVLGATGSIGLNTLDVVERHPERYLVHALAANQSVDKMLELVATHNPRVVVMGDADAAEQVAAGLPPEATTEVRWGDAEMVAIVEDPVVDVVMAAIVGFAGLRPTLAAAEAGKRLLLANKEALVSAGSVFMQGVRKGGAVLLPIDSEHNAMFQCVPSDHQARPQMASVEKIVLTASGGPFRGKTRDELLDVTPEQACAHPNWSMGPKISVDSATLVNKGLELAEACWLFSSTPEKIEVVIHPQSIVHSMIRYTDGSVLAQLGNPDMRTPIAYGLAWPERISAGVQPLDLVAAGRLDFWAPDLDAFPCLRLAQEAIALPGGMCVLNAANEIAVASFLARDIRFIDIDRVIEAALAGVQLTEPSTLEEVEALDAKARECAAEAVANMTSKPSKED